jgi:hypothetical protein
MKKTIPAAEMPAPFENIFGIDNPEEYGCRIFHYQQGHSVMIVRLEKGGDAAGTELYLVFESVMYFQGYLGWTGANFCTAPIEEYMSLMLKASEQVSQNELKYIEQDMSSIPGRLFTVSAKEGVIKLIANTATLSDDIAEWQ